MANGAEVSSDMKNVFLDRGFKTIPANTAYVSGAIGTGTTTPDPSDTVLESIISGWNTGIDHRDYETGFPTFDTTNRRASARVFVSSSQANGNTITEYADFNGDATPKIGGHFVFTGITKTSSIQVFFKPTYRFL